MFRPLIKFRYRIRGIVRGWNYSSTGTSSLTPELEKAFNDQINTEFFASFTYLSMAAHFGRQDVSYPGCHKYFLDQVQDEREHAEKLIFHLLQRGNSVTLKAIQPPSVQCWDSPKDAFKDAIRLENAVTKKLYDLRKFSEDLGDVCSCLFIEDELLSNQIQEYDKLSRYLTQLEKIGADASGLYLFDKYLLKESK